MQRAIGFEEEHDQFRASVRAFFEKAGVNGFLGMDAPAEFGGGGVKDFRYNLIVIEETQRLGMGGAGLGITLHNDICMPYFLHLADEEQLGRWVPGICAGTSITAIAMTEPAIGSDLASMTTTAIRDGDHYVVNGSKTFITNGITAELFFTDVHVPVANLLGAEGEGFKHLVTNLPQERLSIAAAGVAAARAAFDWTLEYARERKAFGQSIGSFQNSKFRLAEMATEIEIGQAFIDQCVLALNDGRLTAEEASMAKWWCTELQGRVADAGVQLHGGYGYMTEYPIAKAYADARITRIYGGTTEIMKEIIGRSLGV